MVFNFIDEQNDYLPLTEEKYEKELQNNQKKTKFVAREYLEYSETNEGYWTSETFMCQIEKVYNIAEIKIPED